jgi:hypothetical protein
MTLYPQNKKNNAGFASYFFRKKDHGCAATPCTDVLKVISRMARSIIGAFACVSSPCLLDCLWFEPSSQDLKSRRSFWPMEKFLCISEPISKYRPQLGA